MSAVAAEWASIALSPALIDAATAMDERLGRFPLQALTNVEDRFIVGLVSELTRQIALDGAAAALMLVGAVTVLVYGLAIARSNAQVARG